MDEIVRAKFASSSWLINPLIGVTRWLNYCKIFGHLQQGKFAQSHNIFAKVRYFLPNTIFTLKIFPTIFKIVPKWRNFPKPGHADFHCIWGRPTVNHVKMDLPRLVLLLIRLTHTDRNVLLLTCFMIQPVTSSYNTGEAIQFDVR